MKRARRMFIAVAFLASLTFAYNISGMKNYIANAEDKEVESSKLSSKRGSITINGRKADIGEENRKYRVVLKKLYTSKDIESSDFFSKYYEVPEYAQGIQVEDGKKMSYNRENIIVADDEGKAIMQDMVLGEYEIREADEGAGIPVHIVRLPLLNNSEDSNFNVEVSAEKMPGGAVEMFVREAGAGVDELEYGLYKVDQIPQADEEGNMPDVEGVKVGDSYKTDENGMIVANDLEMGKYYFAMEEPKKGFLKDEEKHYFEIDRLGKIKNSGGVKIGKVESLNVEVHRSLEQIGGINGKHLEADSNLATPIRFEYTTVIPKNIGDYSDIVITDEFDSKYDIKSVEVSIDGAKADDIPIENNNNNLRIDFSDTSKLINKNKFVVKVIAEIKAEEDSKEVIKNTMKVNYNLLDRALEHQTEETRITPTYGRIRLINVDKTENHPIQGNTFQLKLNDKVVNEGVTDTRGNIRWEKVPYGELIIEQVGASDKYEFEYKLAKPVLFVMDDSGARGSKITVKTPRKGLGLFSEEYLPFTIGGIILIISLFIYLNRRRKKRKINIDKSRVK